MKKKLIWTVVILFFGSALVSGAWESSKTAGALLALVLLIGMAGMWGLFRRPVRVPAHQPKAPTPQPAAPAKPVIKSIIWPSRLEGQPLAYNYRMDIFPADGVDIVKDVLVDQEKILPVGVEGECITILADGVKVAEIRDANRAHMVGDWLRENRPVHAILLASGDKAQLRFYDDPRPRNAFREQTVVELVSYKSAAMQDVSAFLSEGDRLEFEESDDGDKWFVEYRGDPIGRLPTKIEARAKEEAPWGLFVESINEEENDNADTIYHPVVRIFWTNRPNES